MRATFISMAMLLLAFSFVQAQRSCGTAYAQARLAQSPNFDARMREKGERQMNQWLQDHAGKPRQPAIVTIPVVVHVVYRTAAENISAAQIQSQIDVLNEDYARLNADTSQTPVPFRSLAVDTEIRFCLARRDPSGAISTGVTRTLTNVSSFSTNDEVKFNATGGVDAWPRDDYLNIWVCNMGIGLVGYGTAPSQPANVDGVVVNYQHFGRVGNVVAPYDLGRITTHEVGHWLNLEHIWGDDNGTCTGSDFVADTPNQADYTIGCATFPKTDACSPTSPGVMFMNFMDFSDDACMNMFTAGQRDRMQACLATVRSSIANSQACIPPQQVPVDVGISALLAPKGTICSSHVTPEITLINWGIQVISGLDIKWTIDNGPVQNYAWSGSLPSFAAVNVQLTSQALPNGNHDILIWTENPNAQNDGNPSNDTIRGSFSTTAQSPGISLPLFENFESGTFPPVGWIVSNPDNALTWEENASVGFQSGRCAWVNNFDYPSVGEYDDLILPPLDLSGGNASLQFEVAYANYSTSGYSDTLQVLVSTDCGNTFTKIFEKAGSALATATPPVQQNFFVPNGSSDWRSENVDLSSFVGFNSVVLKFRNVADYENNLYLDNVAVSGGTVGVKTPAEVMEVEIFPNPGSGIFRVRVESLFDTGMQLQVFNSMGQILTEKNWSDYDGQEFTLNLEDVASGVYWVHMQVGEKVVTRQLIKR